LPDTGGQVLIPLFQWFNSWKLLDNKKFIA
jgi:hypothetical protein